MPDDEDEDDVDQKIGPRPSIQAMRTAHDQDDDDDDEDFEEFGLEDMEEEFVGSTVFFFLLVLANSHFHSK